MRYSETFLQSRVMGRPTARYWYLIIAVGLSLATLSPHRQCHLSTSLLVGPAFAVLGVAAVVIRPSAGSLRLATLTLFIYSLQFCATVSDNGLMSLGLYFLLLAQIVPTHQFVRSGIRYA